MRATLESPRPWSEPYTGVSRHGKERSMARGMAREQSRTRFFERKLA